MVKEFRLFESPTPDPPVDPLDPDPKKDSGGDKGTDDNSSNGG